MQTLETILKIVFAVAFGIFVVVLIIGYIYVRVLDGILSYDDDGKKDFSTV